MVFDKGDRFLEDHKKIRTKNGSKSPLYIDIRIYI